jgi:hypothetical protein
MEQKLISQVTAKIIEGRIVLKGQLVCRKTQLVRWAIAVLVLVLCLLGLPQGSSSLIERLGHVRQLVQQVLTALMG